MQAIQGALNLALEELDNPEDLTVYLHLSLAESERVIQLLNRMRQIYRPQSDDPERINLNDVLWEVVSLAEKELRRQRITLRADLAPDLPHLIAVANQLHLVFLSLLLNLSDVIGAAGGGELRLRSYSFAETIRIEFVADIPNAPTTTWIDILKPASSHKSADLDFGLSFSQDIIASHGGVIEFNRQDQRAICIIELPRRMTNDDWGAITTVVAYSAPIRHSPFTNL